MLIPTKLLKFVFALNVAFLVMLAFSYPHIEPGTPSYVAAVLTFGAICVMLLLVSALFVVKQRRETI